MKACAIPLALNDSATPPYSYSHSYAESGCKTQPSYGPPHGDADAHFAEFDDEPELCRRKGG